MSDIFKRPDEMNDEEILSSRFKQLKRNEMILIQALLMKKTRKLTINMMTMYLILVMMEMMGTKNFLPARINQKRNILTVKMF